MLTTLLKMLFPASTERELSHPDMADHQAMINRTSTHRNAYCPGGNTIRSRC